VSNNIEKLIASRIIREGRPQTGKCGRSPTPLFLGKDLFFSAGVRVAHEFSELTIVNSDGSSAGKSVMRHSGGSAYDFLGGLASAVKAMLAKAGVPADRFIGFGISISGLLDTDKSVLLNSFSFANDNDVPVGKFLYEKFGRPALLINSSHLLALNEHKSGKAQNMEDFLYFGSGYGLGIFLNGKLCRGHQRNAGEAGYMQLQSEGELADDGRRGTLLTEKPYFKIPSKIREVLAKGGDSLIRKYLTQDDPDVTLDKAVKAAADGDSLCAHLIGETFEVIGRAAVNLAYIFNPEAIFFEPFTALCPEVTIETVKKALRHYSIHNRHLRTEVLPASGGREHLAAAAGRLAAEEYIFSKAEY
jgi:predicted NBD/HSP70 family sugar kinase